MPALAQNVTILMPKKKVGTAVFVAMSTGGLFGASTAGSNRSGDAFAEWRKEKMPVKVGQ